VAVRHLPWALVTRVREGAARGDRRWSFVAKARKSGGIPPAVRVFSLPDDEGARFVSAPSLVLHQLFWAGTRGWEPELLDVWRRLCRRSGKVLELGSNVGYYAVQGARAAPDVEYVAVEPHPDSVQICGANLELNQVRNVRLVHAAAVAHADDCPTELVVPDDQLRHPTVAFLAGDSELPSAMTRGPTRALRISTVEIAELLPGVDLIKLDVEGQEHQLLAAAWDHLAAHHPAIVVEVLPGTPRLRQLLARLCDELGYRCYAPTERGLVPVAHQDLPGLHLQTSFRTNDVVLTHVP
jgi:FkbM family methyltransferase